MDFVRSPLRILHAGKEFIASIKLENRRYAASEDEADRFRLTLGDAIERRCVIQNSDSTGCRGLFAEGEVADWLDNAPCKGNMMRIRLLFGTYGDTTFVDGGMTTTKASKTGFKLMEAIDDDACADESS